MRVTSYLELGASHRGPLGHLHPVCSPSPQGSPPWYGNRNLQTKILKIREGTASARHSDHYCHKDCDVSQKDLWRRGSEICAHIDQRQLTGYPFKPMGSSNWRSPVKAPAPAPGTTYPHCFCWGPGTPMRRSSQNQGHARLHHQETGWPGMFCCKSACWEGIVIW